MNGNISESYQRARILVSAIDDRAHASRVSDSRSLSDQEVVAGGGQAAVGVLLPGDLGQVAEILRDQRIFLPMEIERALEVCQEAAHHPFQDYWGYRAVRHGRVVGFVVFGPIPMTLGCWDIYWLAVDPACRRSGIGRQLLAYMEEQVRRQQARHLYVETSSLPGFAPARCLYEGMGFACQACLVDYFRPGVDKLVYGKRC